MISGYRMVACTRADVWRPLGCLHSISWVCRKLIFRLSTRCLIQAVSDPHVETGSHAHGILPTEIWVQCQSQWIEPVYKNVLNLDLAEFPFLSFLFLFFLFFPLFHCFASPRFFTERFTKVFLLAFHPICS